MGNKDLARSAAKTLVQVECPACPGQFALVELIGVEEVHCPKCGNDWRVRLQDVPGRVLVDLLPLEG